MTSIFTTDKEVRVIEVRHLKRLFEALVSSRESCRSEEMGDHLRARMDGRNLNCGKLFDPGDTGEIAMEDYSSHNTTWFTLPEGQKLLLSLPEVRRGLEAVRV